MTATARTTGQQLPRRRRNVELGPVLLAVAVCLAGYGTANPALDNALPGGLPVYGTGLTVLAVLLHLVVRRFATYADPLLLPPAIFLSGFGLVLLDRLDRSCAL